MKKLFAALCLLAAGAAHAQDATEQRIKSDILVRAIVDGVNQKYHVTCDLAGARAQLDCGGGYGCSYSLYVDCPAYLGGVDIRISGFDNGTQTGVGNVAFTFLR